MNFIVENKMNGELYEVFDIAYNKVGYPNFLIYKDGQWLRMSAKYFKPVEDNIIDMLSDGEIEFLKNR